MALQFEIDQSIGAPPERVFEVLVDLDQAKHWMQGFVSLEKLTPGDVGVGTQFRETRKLYGREASEVFEITEIEAPRRFGLYVDGTKGSTKRGEFRFTYSVVPAGSGSRVVLSGTVSGMGWFGDLMAKLFKGMFTKSVRKDLVAMKTYIESA